MNTQIKIDDQKQIELAAEMLVRLLIKQVVNKKSEQINKNIEMNKYGEPN